MATCVCAFATPGFNCLVTRMLVRIEKAAIIHTLSTAELAQPVLKGAPDVGENIPHPQPARSAWRAIRKLPISMSTRCRQPGVAKCARKAGLPVKDAKKQQ